ncbi:MAG: alpha/beta hydrolase [Pseudomonadota bacterium]
MQFETFSLTATDGRLIPCFAWRDEENAARATVQIAHGMGEHAQRYAGLAEALTNQGFAVYASTHRGHGEGARATPGAMGPNGWRSTVGDMHELARFIRSRHAGLRHVLFGHSMGAMLTQQYLTLHGGELDAAVLSGSPGFAPGWRGWLLQALASFEAWRHGADGQSELLTNMLFGASNESFDKPEATGYEWLSRDELEVEKYVQDPDCGFVLSPGSLAAMSRGVRRSAQPVAIEQIPQSLPVYVFSGSDDPVHDDENGLLRLLRAYRGAGLSVDYKLYPGGRHEMLNETNRVEVVADLLAWLDAKLAP